ncbi:MAG TPA: S8 family peptidase [Limnobacter sp.]|nr:S8 family peptidase [Limnobacter sp.]
MLRRFCPVSIPVFVFLLSGALFFKPAWSAERWVIQFKENSSVVQRMAAQESVTSRNTVLSQKLAELSGVYRQPFSLIRSFGDRGMVVSVPEGADFEQVRQRLLSDPAIEAVDMDRRIRLHAQSPLVGLLNELDLSRQTRTWFHQDVTAQPASINTGAMWSNFHGTAPSIVAVLDTGVLPSHPMLIGHLLPGYDFVSDSIIAADGQRTGNSERDADPSDPGDGVTAADLLADPACAGLSSSSWHGTFVSGLLAGNPAPSEGVLSVNWNAAIVPIRVLGKCGGFSTDLADGIRWAAGLTVPGVPNNPFPARVINLSLGAQGACVGSIEGSAISAARQAGSLVVVAAGNDGSGVDSPANCPGAFGVAAIDQEGLKASYSNFGATIQLSAPGGDGAFPIWSASNTGIAGPLTNTYRTKTGTSFSSPMVAAAASLYLSVNPAASVANVESVLKSSARPFLVLSNRPVCSTSNPGVACNCTTALCGAGMLDVARVVGTLSSGGFTNLFSNSGNVLPPGSTGRFFSTGSTDSSGQEVTSVSFDILNVQKSVAGAPDPVLSSSGLTVDVTAPAGVVGFDLRARVASGRTSVVSVTVAESGPTSPTLLAGLLSPLLGTNPGENLGVPATSGGDSPVAGSGSGSGAGGGGGGGGTGFAGLLMLAFLLMLLKRNASGRTTASN